MIAKARADSARRRTRARLRAVVAGVAAAPALWLAAVAASAAPSVASMNLCADQLVLTLADPGQILTVSWLAADAEESMLPDAARRYPLNYGSAEELLRFDPDVVVAGAYTNAFARALLARLGYTVLELDAEDSIDDIVTNVRRVAAAVEQPARGERLLEAMQADLQRIAAARPAELVAGIVVRPGGYTVGSGSLAHDVMTLAGVRNVAAELGLDRWGSLSMETLVRARATLVVLTGYRAAQPSLANAALAHPALAQVRREARTATVPSAYWACGLPRSLESAQRLQAALGPQ